MKCQNCGKENKNSNISCEYCYPKLINENLSHQENLNNYQEEKIENISKKIGCFVTMIPFFIGAGTIIIACLIFILAGTSMFLSERIKTIGYNKITATIKDFRNCTYEYSDEEYCEAIYEFQVEGITYTVSPKQLSPRDQFAQTVTAYYNPNNPSEAVTYTKSSGGLIIFGIIILAIIIIKFNGQKQIAQKLTKEIINTTNNRSQQ